MVDLFNPNQTDPMAGMQVPPWLKSHIDQLIASWQQTQARAQGPIGQRETQPPMALAGDIGQSALARANQPIDNRNVPPSLIGPTPAMGTPGLGMTPPGAGNPRMDDFATGAAPPSLASGGTGQAPVGASAAGLPNFSQGMSAVGNAIAALPSMVGLGGQQPPGGLPTGTATGAWTNPRADDIGGAYAPSSLAGGAAGMPQYSGSLNRLLNESVGERLLAAPEVAMTAAFRQLGVNPQNNMFARRAVDRYAPVLGSLAQIWSWVATGDPNKVDANTVMPQFLQHFMTGGDVKGLMAQAFKLATPGSLGEAALGELGAEDLSGILEATRGTAPMFAAARRRVLNDKLMNRSIADLNKPMDQDDFGYLQDIRSTYGI